MSDIKPFYKDIPFDAEFFVKAAQRVIDWNMKARNTTEEAFKKAITLGDIQLQTKLVLEELKEYRDAYAESDFVEMADAAADTFVVTSFLSYLYFGGDATKAFNINRPADYLAEDPYESFLRSHEMVGDEMGLGFLASKFMLMSRDSLIRSRFNEKKILTEVLNSNDSKFPKRKQLLDFHNTKNIEDALQAEVKWIEENRGHTGITYTYNAEYKVYAFFNENGKIMKPSSFVEPDLSKYIK